jgi:UDPglucose 6-dehydrogenase
MRHGHLRPEASSHLRVSVIGLGKLGSPLAACLAAKGFTTIGVDRNEAYVEAINDGRAPVYEPHLAEMIAEGHSCLTATDDVAHAVEETDATFVIVPTPSQEDGNFSLEFVLDAMEAIGRALKTKHTYHLVVLTSTVMPGSTGGPVRAALEAASGRCVGADFGLCYSPEFIALGSVVRDLQNPDFLLIGESDERAGEALADIYRNFVENDPPVARLNFVNAELAKLSVNAFVTTKIAFANSLARICERVPEASVDAVTSALGLDSRIGARYLRGAIPYGGPCFPRDNQAFTALARALEMPAFVAEATDMSNRDGVDRLAQLSLDFLPEHGTVAVLGLAYKPNTNVVDESPGLLLAQALDRLGAVVVAFDPAAAQNAGRLLTERIQLTETAIEAVQLADVIVVTTPWQEFSALDPAAFERQPRRVLLDCWRQFPRERFEPYVHLVPLGEALASSTATVA